MIPSFPLNNLSNIGFRYPVLSGQASMCFARTCSLSDSAHIGISQFRLAMTFAHWGELSPLLIAVCNVFELCAKEQMIWVAAGRVVALVQDASIVAIYPYGYRAIMELIGDTMGRIFLALPLEVPIFLICWSLPKPAIFWLTRITVCPEGFLQRITKTSNVVARHKQKWLALRPAFLSMCLWGNSGLLPATAVAITMRDFLQGLTRGMIAHVEKLLSAFGQSPGRLPSPLGNFYWSLPSIIAQVCGG